MQPSSTLIPMSSPDIGDAEIEAVTAVLRSGALSLGPKLREFEEEFARYIGTRHAVAVSSGTAALHLALLAEGIGPGDEVLTSPFSFIASANCILHAGANVRFVDIDPVSMAIDPAACAEAVRAETRAILPVHVFGQSADMDGLARIAREKDLVLVEDACEAVGTEYRGQRIGTCGNSAVFSFYPNKQMTTGEGAVITTDSPDTARMLNSLRNQGRDEGGAWLSHRRLGYNYRLSDIAAALGLVQLSRIDELLAAREQVAGYYCEHLAGIAGVRLMPVAEQTSRVSWFAAIVRLDDGIDRDEVISRLAGLGIPARAYFAPIHLQPFYRERFGYREGDFPITERVASGTLALPFHGRMTEDQVAMVCSKLAESL